MRFALPSLGLGTAGIGGLYRRVAEQDAQTLLQTAWERGIRYFDTAPFYGCGLAEQRLGRFLAGVAPPVIVSTKVGRVLEPDPSPDFVASVEQPFPLNPRYDYSYDGLMRSLDSSVLRLGRIPDVVLIHDIGVSTHGAEGNARHMSDLSGSGFRALEQFRSGGVRMIGIGVNEVEACQVFLSGEIELDVILLAGRYTALDRTGTEVIRRAAAKGVQVVAAGVLNSGILATGTAQGAKFNYATAPDDVVGQVKRLEHLAQNAGISLRRVAMQFPRRNPGVTTTLLGAATSTELTELLDDLDASVPANLWTAFDRLPAIGLTRQDK